MNDSVEEKGEKVEGFEPLVGGIDFYIDDGLMVLTNSYLLKRGYCCKNGCRHCPYGFVPDVSE